MQVATVTLKGASPYSQSKYIDTEAFPKNGKETPDAYEKRSWDKRIHLDSQGIPFMPAMSLKKCIEGAASYSGKIPGQGQATYTKPTKSGLLITDNIELRVGDRPARFEDWEGEWLFLDAQGKNGDKRVKRRMPRLSNWSAIAKIYVLNEVFSDEILEKILIDAGRFVGVGRFRPEKGGFYGRFTVQDLDISDFGGQ